MYIDQVYERGGTYIREPSRYFIDRCLGGYAIDSRDTCFSATRDFESIVHDLHHSYGDGLGLPELVHRFVGKHAKVTQDNVLIAVRAAFTYLDESGRTCIDEPYSDVRDTFDMIIACHPKFDTKFGSYLPSRYELDHDDYGYWTVTATGYDEDIIYVGDGDGYLILDSQEVVDDVSWVKAARNAVRMFKGCSAYDAGFTGVPTASVQRGDVITALRKAVNDQIVEYRRKHKAQHNGVYIDAVDGKVLSPANSHVDHYPVSFMRLVNMWLDSQRCDIKDIAVASTFGDFNGVVMSNDAQRRSWQDYHRQHATLRIVSKKRNLSLRHY